jgi:hypothetical protein
MSFSGEPSLRDEIARLQPLVEEKDALLVQQQQQQQQQQRKTSTQRPLTYGHQTQESVILDLVIPRFVGSSEYCFLAGVSRGWRAQQLKLNFAGARSINRTTDKLRTSLRAVLTTAARLQWAFDNGLTAAVFDSIVTPLQVVKLVQEVVADATVQTEVLLSARVHGCKSCDSICADAARAGDLHTLMWVRERNCTWVLDEVLYSAAEGGHTSVLQWLHSNSERPWTAEEQSRMLFAAGHCSDLTAAKWLRANGAAWPGSFYDPWLDRAYDESFVWPAATVQWALDSGCKWGEWDCDVLEPETPHANETETERRMRELFEWAHLNNCPCTCPGHPFDDDDNASVSSEEWYSSSGSGSSGSTHSSDSSSSSGA